MAIIGWNPTTELEVATGLLRIYGNPVTDEAIQKNLDKLREVKTSFTLDGKRYLVQNLIYYINKPVELPDGRQVNVHGWLESSPPQGWGKLIEDLFPFTDVYKAVEA